LPLEPTTLWILTVLLFLTGGAAGGLLVSYVGRTGRHGFIVRNRLAPGSRDKQREFLLEDLLLGEWPYDAATGQISADPAVFRMYGAEGFSGPAPAAWFVDRLHPDDRKHVDETWAIAIQTGANLNLEYRTVWPDGSIHWIIIRTKPAATGPQRWLYGVNMDITALKEAEAALSRSESDFRELADAMPQIVWINTQSGEPVFTNKRWHDFSGCAQPEKLTETLWKLIHPDDAHGTHLAFTGALESGTLLETEHRLWDRQRGTYRWHLVRALQGFDENGRIIRWYGTSTDIDDMKRGQEQVRALNSTLEKRVRRRTAELSDSEQLLKLTVEGIRDYAILALDPGGEGYGLEPRRTPLARV
jgi:PAS domain S-box-containing protein